MKRLLTLQEGGGVLLDLTCLGGPGKAAGGRDIRVWAPWIKKSFLLETLGGLSQQQQHVQRPGGMEKIWPLRGGYGRPAVNVCWGGVGDWDKQGRKGLKLYPTSRWKVVSRRGSQCN